MTRYFVTIALFIISCFASTLNVFAASLIDTRPINKSSKTRTGKTISTPLTNVSSLRLRCYISDNQGKSSRAVVLQITPSHILSKDYDIAITTGHGLLDDQGEVMKDCLVNRPGGKPQKIITAKLAPDYREGQSSDWAIIVIKKIKTNTVIRHQIGVDMNAKITKDIADAHMPVLFSKARGLPQNEQSCTLLPRQYAGLTRNNHTQLLAHSCKAISGQSGSPITIMRDDQAVVLGIHIGSSMIYAHPKPSSPLRLQGYMRVIDQELMSTFSDMLSELEIELARKGTE